MSQPPMADQTIHPLKQMSETLKEFWQRLGERENQGANHGQPQKLEALGRLGMVKFAFKRAESKSSLRSKFELYKEAK